MKKIFERKADWAGLGRDLGALCAGILLLSGAGCASSSSPASPAKAAVDFLRINPTNRSTVAVVNAEVMRFADTYAATVAQTADDISASTARPEARLEALEWKLSQATSAYIDATGPNPTLNALDMLVLATMARIVVEDYGIETYGDDAVPLLETQRQLETNAWTLASAIMKPGQQAEVRDLIQEWRRKNPNQRNIGPIRFREFAEALGKAPEQTKTSPNSIFGLLFLDPLAGLDPTTAAIEETRLLGERAMYYTQRMPQLLSWQAEVLVCQIALQPQSKQMFSDASRLAASAESFARTTEQFPQLVNDQREAAIKQVLDGLASEQMQGRQMLAEARQTLDSANSAAASVNAAIKSLDAFVHYVNPPDGGQTPPSTNSKPFDVLDYGKSAAQIGAAARDLNTLLATMNQSAPQLAQMGDQASAKADRVVQHAFRLGLVLIAIALVGWVLASVARHYITLSISKAAARTVADKSKS